MDEVFGLILAAIVAFVVGILIGGGVKNDEWANDCKILHQHRYGVAVYECRKIVSETSHD